MDVLPIGVGLLAACGLVAWVVLSRRQSPLQSVELRFGTDVTADAVAAFLAGVAFVAGAFFLTDSMRDSFERLFTEASQGIDVQVQTKEYKDLIEKQATSAPGTVSIDLSRVGVPPSVVEQIKEIDGVKAVAGSVFEFGAQALDKKGKPISTGGAPSFGHASSPWSRRPRHSAHRQLTRSSSKPNRLTLPSSQAMVTPRSRSTSTFRG